MYATYAMYAHKSQLVPALHAIIPTGSRMTVNLSSFLRQRHSKNPPPVVNVEQDLNGFDHCKIKELATVSCMERIEEGHEEMLARTARIAAVAAAATAANSAALAKANAAAAHMNAGMDPVVAPRYGSLRGRTGEGVKR